MEHRNEFFGIEAGYFADMVLTVDSYKEQVAKAAGVAHKSQVANFMKSLEDAEDIIATLPSDKAEELRRVIRGIVGFSTIYSTIEALDYKQYKKMVKAEAESIKG